MDLCESEASPIYEDFRPSQGYIVRSFLEKKKNVTIGQVRYTPVIPATLNVEAGGLKIQGPPG